MQQIDLFKKMIPGLLPLFVFILADSLWGTEVGLLIAISFGVLECTYIYARERRLDKFILADMALLVLLGGVSILLHNEIFFKLKPALIQGILCAILGISAFSGKNLMLMMSQRYMKGVVWSQQQQKAMTTSMRVLFFIILAHSLLVVYAAYFMSNAAWAFISGGLFYIIFGLYFMFEFARNKMKAKRVENEEWFPLVDEAGNITGKAPRSYVHQHPELLHPVVHLHVINKKKELFLQKRPNWKETEPGKWDVAVGGHISFGENVEDALMRETEEEIGLTHFSPVFVARHIIQTAFEKELVYMFMTHYDQPIQINPAELTDGRFWTREEIRQNLKKNIFTPGFQTEFAILKERKIL